MMVDWPFPRRLSPHYPEVAIESINWILGVRPVDERFKAILRKTNIGENIIQKLSLAMSSLLFVE